MKKIIVFFLCVMIACLVYDMAFAQEETIYYSENFESGGFNTNSNAGTPYWTLDATTGGTVSVGKDPKNILNKCLILNKTTPNDGTKVEISLHTGNVNPTSAQHYVVVEGRIMFSAISGSANLFFMYGGATSAGRLMTSAMYNKYVFTGGDTNKKIIPEVDANQWYDIKYVIDSSKDINTYDVFINGVYTTTVEDESANAKFNTYSVNRLLFGMNHWAMTLFIDDLRVYTASEKDYIIYCNERFDSEILNTNIGGGAPYWRIDATTGGTVSVVKDPKDVNNNCLVISKTSANDNGATKAETSLILNDVRPTASQPYVVVEGRVMFSATSGKSNLFYMFGGPTSAGRLMKNALYNDFVFSTETVSDSTKLISKIEANTWYNVRYVIDTSKEHNTYDVVVNGKYVNTITDTGASNQKFNSLAINRLLFGANYNPIDVYLDDIKVCTTKNSRNGSWKDTAQFLPYEDPGRMSDESFFGRWDSTTQRWAVEPALNYEFDDSLSTAKSFAMEGRYAEAKEAVLHYYRNRSHIKPSYSGVRNQLMAELGAKNIFVMENMPVDKINIEGNSLCEYSINVPVNQYSFMFFPEDKSENSVLISSRESQNPPVLEIVQQGKTVCLPVSKDMYVSAGANSDINYGSAQDLKVSDMGNPVDETTCIPYMVFDTSAIDRSLPVSEAKLKFYAKTDTGFKSVYLFVSSESMWSENTAVFKNVSGRVYSWNGIEGGSDWKKPPYAHTEFLNVVLRMIFLDSMVAEYKHTGNEYFAYKSIAQYLDFIKDNGGLTYDPERKVTLKSLNAGFRGTGSVNAFFALLDSESMTAEAAVSILKYIYEEGAALALDEHFHESNNAGNYELNSLLTMTAYFPEMMNNSHWREVVSLRLDRLADILIRDDGSYAESTSGYDAGVLSSFTHFYSLADISGIELSDKFAEKYHRFAKYMMGITRPDGKEPDWGDGTNSVMRSYLYNAAKLTDDADLYYVGTEGRMGTVPDFTSVYYPQGKLAVMRTGWGKDDAYTFIIGRLGGSHSHMHNMHMSIFAYGRYLLTDTGMTSYDPVNPNFLWQRENNISHNFIKIDDVSPPLMLDNSGEALSDADMYSNSMFDFFRGYTNQYKDFTQYRNIMFLKKSRLWLVTDYVEPSDDEIHKYNLNWHTAADSDITMDEGGNVRTNYTFGANLGIMPVSNELLVSSLEDGVSVLTGPRDTAETKYTSYVKHTAGPVSFDTVITAMPQGEDTEINVESMPVDNNRTVTAFSIKNISEKTNAYYYFSHEKEPLSHCFGSYTTNGRLAYLEHNSKGELSLFAAADVEIITDNGKIILETYDNIKDISVSYNGATLVMETSAVPDDVRSIKVYAPEIDTILFNGRKNIFERDGEYVIISKVGEPFYDSGIFDFSDILFTYDGIQPANGLVANSTIKVKFNATRIGDDANSLIVIAALYDNSGSLMAVDIVKPDISGEEAQIEASLKIPSDFSNGYVKAFKWGSVCDAAPYDVVSIFAEK